VPLIVDHHWEPVVWKSGSRGGFWVAGCGAESERLDGWMSFSSNAGNAAADRAPHQVMAYPNLLREANDVHEKLLKVVRRLQTDYEPYGTVSRDGESDCSCGCRHFAKLAHEVGNDWGICSNPESPRAGLLTFEHQGCAAFSPITLDPSLADSQLRQIIAEASGLLSDRRSERSGTIERPDPSFPAESGEFIYDIRTSYFPKIKSHFPSIFRMERHENGFVAVPLEASVSGKERPVVIARASAKNGEAFKIVRGERRILLSGSFQRNNLQPEAARHVVQSWFAGHRIIAAFS
jgi:hypothetical protein